MSKSKEKSKQNVISTQLLSIGFALLLFMFGTIIFTSLAFFVGGGVSPVWPILSFLGTVVLMYYYLNKKGVVLRRIIISIVAVFCLIGASIAIAGSFYDSSYDGNSYHKVAVGSLKNGWNPVYEDVASFNSQQGSHTVTGAKGLSDEDVGRMWLWINHYPKGGWVFAANIYSITGNIEAGKATSLLIILATFFIALAFFYTRIGRNKALIISLLLAANPIIVTQMLSYYNDGILGNVLILLFLFFAYLMSNKKDSGRFDTWFYLVGILMAIVLATGLKFTGLAYSGIVCVSYLVYFIVKKDWRIVKKLSIIGGVALALSLGVVGASSYLSNTISHHNPFYPLAGKGSVDIMSTQLPDGFKGKNRAYTFLKANFSDTHDDQEVKPKLKIPFSISKNEIEAIHTRYPDLRVAGYGVWFGGVLILSFFIFLYLLVWRKIYKQKYFWMALVPITSVAVTALIFDNAWWARYLPQLIVLPIILIAIMFHLKFKTLPYILSFILLFNTMLTGALVLDFQTRYTNDAKAAIRENLKCNTESRAPEMWSAELHGTLYNIWDRCSAARTVPAGLAKSIPEERLVDVYSGLHILLPPENVR